MTGTEKESMKARRTHRRAGQTTTEFAIMAAMLTLSVVVMALFLWTFRQYGGRILGLVASEFP
jgi:hypothetical protein